MINMERKTFEQVDETTNLVSKTLADKVLALHANDFGLVTLDNTDGLYVPEFTQIKLEIDVLPLLIYQKQYGIQKTRALLKPWVANILAVYPNIEALGFVRDDYGIAYLFGFQKTASTVVNKIAVLKKNNTLKLLKPSPVKVK